MLELLSPAGSYEGFIAALAAGADAVYAGGSAYGARAYAKNFSDDEFLRAIDVAHLYGKKLYMTVNTLCKERELNDLLTFLKPFYLQGLDGVIVQDIGVIAAVRTAYPDMEIHASTQMTLTGSAGAKYAIKAGAVRIVPARELSLKEIKRIHDESGVEIESFIHGAMCYCYSGQCLLSGFLGGRSGNRGRCAQPCRLPYTTSLNGQIISDASQEYVISMKDLNTIKILPQLIESGITSFKIEGRMKKPEYTALVTSMYRKYIDLYLSKGAKGYKVSKEDYSILSNAYVRTDPEEGYYHRHNGPELITLSKPSYESEIPVSLSSYELKKLPVAAFGSFIENSTSSLTLCLDDISVTVYGSLCQSAVNHPLSVDDIEKQLQKTGSTEFDLNDPQIYLEGNIFMSKKDINELRRSAIEAFRDEILTNYRRRDVYNVPRPAEALEKEFEHLYSVSVETVDQLRAAAEFAQRLDRIYVELDLLIKNRQEAEDIIFSKGISEKYYISLPYIFRDENERKVIELLDRLNSGDVVPTGYLVRNYEELQLAGERFLGKKIVTDFNLYSFNSLACRELLSSGADELTIPAELNIHEIKERGYLGKSEMLFYGYIPMMISAGCPLKTLNKCSKGIKNDVCLTDRTQAQFRVITDCSFCYNRILNSVPISLFSEREALEKLAVRNLRLAFTIESGRDCAAILKAALDGEEIQLKNYTKGHFRKSVE